jgi:4a-hydroxytetrahydrobiopterin dehydratase
MACLTPKQIKAGFNAVTNWSQRSKGIDRTYWFDGVLNGVAFVHGVARMAQNNNHHPEIEIKFDQVTVSLAKHRDGGITEKDFVFARQCDQMFLKSFGS